MRNLAWLACGAFACGAFGGCGGGSESAPVLTALEPASGIVGTTVTLTGELGDERGEVRVGGVVATVLASTDTSLQIEIPDVFPGTTRITVSNDAGEAEPLEFFVVLPDAIYVASSRDRDTIHTFALARGDGSVIGLAPVDTGATAPIAGGCGQTLAVHVATRRLFAVHHEAISVLDIDPRTGAVTPIAGSPFSIEAAIGYRGLAVDRGGRRMFVSFAMEPTTSGIRTFSIGLDGRLDKVADVLFARPPPVGGMAYVDMLALSNSERHLYTNPESTEGVNGFAVAADGRLTELAGSPFQVGIHAARSVAVRPTADQLMVPTDDGIYVFGFSDADGALVEHPQSPFTNTGIEQNFVQLAWAGPDRIVVSAAEFNPTPDFVAMQVDAEGAPSSPTPPRVDIARMFCMRVSRDGAYLVGTTFEDASLGVVELAPEIRPLTGSPFRFSGVADPRGVATTF